jgi:hypothetical protein
MCNPLSMLSKERRSLFNVLFWLNFKIVIIPHVFIDTRRTYFLYISIIRKESRYGSAGELVSLGRLYFGSQRMEDRAGNASTQGSLIMSGYSGLETNFTKPRSFFDPRPKNDFNRFVLRGAGGGALSTGLQSELATEVSASLSELNKSVSMSALVIGRSLFSKALIEGFRIYKPGMVVNNKFEPSDEFICRSN